MLTFLFWNLKQARVDILASLARQYAVDVLILAECPVLPSAVLSALNEHTADYYYVAVEASECQKVRIFSRFLDEYVLPLRNEANIIAGTDFLIRRLVLPGRPELLLCAVHFPSKLRQEGIDQTLYTVRFAELLAKAESVANHTRTILVGDLNMNPYENGVVTAAGLHAVMTRTIAQKKTRRVKFTSNLFFYNPMWSHFGEKKAGHAGTYYYSSPKQRADFWNIYDQVLVRPALLPNFRDEDIQVLWQDLSGDESLLTSDGVPNKDSISDHLPILFRLEI